MASLSLSLSCQESRSHLINKDLFTYYVLLCAKLDLAAAPGKIRFTGLL